MKKAIIMTAFACALSAPGAFADGFSSCAGYSGNSHYAIENLITGSGQTANIILSHGSVPVIATHVSAITEISAPASAITVTVSADGNTAVVSGAAAGSAWQIFGIDGRAVCRGTLSTEQTIALGNLSGGHYLLRIVSSEASHVAKIFKSL